MKPHNVQCIVGHGLLESGVARGRKIETQPSKSEQQKQKNIIVILKGQALGSVHLLLLWLFCNVGLNILVIYCLLYWPTVYLSRIIYIQDNLIQWHFLI